MSREHLDCSPVSPPPSPCHSRPMAWPEPQWAAIAIGSVTSFTPLRRKLGVGARADREKMPGRCRLTATKEAARLKPPVSSSIRLISLTLTGKGDRKVIEQPLPASARTSAVASEVLTAQAGRSAPGGDGGQGRRRRTRYNQTAGELRRLGLSPERYVKVPAMGGL